MQPLLRSEHPLFCIQFRDYVYATYREELILREEIQEGTSVTALYVQACSPHLEQIIHDCRLYAADPFAPRFTQAAWHSGKASSHNIRYSMRDVLHGYQINLSGLLRHGTFTLFLTVLCMTIYLFQWFGQQEKIMAFAHYPAYIEENIQIWRYLTHTLVHLSPWHILFNLVWWWIFAGLIERRYGSVKLILLFVISGVVSGLCQNFFTGPAFFGLSGVVYAVLGFVFIVDQYGRQRIFHLPPGFFNMLIVGIILGFVSPLIDIEMGNAAHIAGLISGLLFGFFQTKSIRQG